MIYQFEHEEIKDCYGCPLVDGEYGDCNITGTEGVDGVIPADCPLVAISKTETTSCEWCERELSFEVVWYSFGSSFVDKATFCPNCGRRLEEVHDEPEN